MKAWKSFLAVLSLVACGTESGTTGPFSQTACLQNPRATATTPEIAGFNEMVTLSLDNGTETQAYLRSVPEHVRIPQALTFVTGVDGGVIQPVSGIYSRMAEWWAARGGESAFVVYRYPGNLTESVRDARGAMDYLKIRGAREFALAGWSFGGAVVIQTAAVEQGVGLVIGFSPQARDTDTVSQFDTERLLLFHSVDDENVPYAASPDILARAPDNLEKQLVTIQGALHRLDGFQNAVDPAVFEWLEKLGPFALPGVVPGC